MSWFTKFYQQIASTHLQSWLSEIPRLLQAWEKCQAGEQQYLFGILRKLLTPTECPFLELEHQVRIGRADDLSVSERRRNENLLRLLSPWRKGPFEVFGTHIDTEWRSDWKWQRVYQHITPLTGRYVLDVGCGSGYHLWRMLGAGVHFAVGVDPSVLFWCQFRAIWQLAGQPNNIHVLPIGVENLPAFPSFDTVFSMGVLYHRRSPIEHLEQLKHQLKPSGELILETLIIADDVQQLLVPKDRYGKMSNIWFIPSCTLLCTWLKKVGFVNVRVVDVSLTTTDEQRSTSWMQNESLSDFLDLNDITKTIEGHPAPRRAIFVAEKAKNL